MVKPAGQSATMRTSSLSRRGIGHVGLKVANLKKSCKFYQEILGLPTEVKNSRTAIVRTGPDVLILYQNKSKGSAFHFGFRLDSSKQVDKWRKQMKSYKQPIYQDIRQKDHPRSFKIRDPDGYFIEISSSK